MLLAMKLQSLAEEFYLRIFSRKLGKLATLWLAIVFSSQSHFLPPAYCCHYSSEHQADSDIEKEMKNAG